jgi:hypothetical protein
MARTEPAISKANSTPPAVADLMSSIAFGFPGLKVSVAPSCRASPSLSSERSTATIRRAPTATAPRSELKPTPPRPITATLEPADTFAVLITAPTPVKTAHPNKAASSSGYSLSIFTSDLRETVAYSAKAETPR